MPAVRVFPPAGISGGFAPKNPVTIGDREYQATPGAFLDVPWNVGQELRANGWLMLSLVGPTAERPFHRPGTYDFVSPRGVIYFDTSIRRLVVHDGETWRDVLTADPA